MSEVAGTRVGKRAELRARQRRQRRRLLAGATAFVLLAAAATFLLVKNGGSSSVGNKAPVRTQKTLLFQVTGSDGSAVMSALLADDRKSKTGAVVLIQPQVLANVPGVGSGQFGGLCTGASCSVASPLDGTVSVQFVPTAGILPMPLRTCCLP